MEVKFSKSALKFLKKLDQDTVERVRGKILFLLSKLEVEGVIPFAELDIKKLEGEWDGSFRLRVGKIRVVFEIDDDLEELIIQVIRFRGDAYNK